MTALKRLRVVQVPEFPERGTHLTVLIALESSDDPVVVRDRVEALPDG